MKATKWTVLAAAAVLGLSSTAMADTVTATQPGESWPADQTFAGRARGMSQGNWELAVGQLPGQAGQFDSTDYNWVDGQETSWSFSYDGAKTASFTLGDAATSWTLDNRYEIDAIYLRPQNYEDGKVNLTGVNLDGTKVLFDGSTDELSVVDGHQLWQIDPVNPGAFNLSGQVTFTGDAAGQWASESSKVDVIASGHVVPVPAAAWGGLALLGTLGGARLIRRRREA
ncbi:MAG: choice-of-anchor W domain-containing protein [Phycisphaeraceae bacterium]